MYLRRTSGVRTNLCHLHSVLQCFWLWSVYRVACCCRSSPSGRASLTFPSRNVTANSQSSGGKEPQRIAKATQLGLPHWKCKTARGREVTFLLPEHHAIETNKSAFPLTPLVNSTGRLFDLRLWAATGVTSPLAMGLNEGPSVPAPPCGLKLAVETMAGHDLTVTNTGPGEATFCLVKVLVGNIKKKGKQIRKWWTSSVKLLFPIS